MAVVLSTAVRDALDHPMTTDWDFGEDTVRSTDEAVDFALARRSHNGFSAMVGNDRTLFTNQSRFSNQEDIVDLPVPLGDKRPTTTLCPLQEWEGYVIEISDEEFIARLLDLTAGDSYEGEEANIPLDELSETDIEKMQIGSIFRWVIGYERTAAGTKKRVSHIVFRDLPVIAKRDLKTADEWALGILADWKE